MRKKKIRKITGDILLSIKYSRLKEEVSDSIVKMDLLTDKKKLIGSNDKQIKKEETFINKTKEHIKDIESNYSLSQYNLYEDDKIQEKLYSISHLKNYEMIKYTIVLGIITDNTMKYTNDTKFDFIENISMLLYKNRNTIKKIQTEYENISNAIYGTKALGVMNKTISFRGGIIPVIPLNKKTLKLINVPGKLYIGLGTAVAASGFGIYYYKLRKQARKMSTMEAGELSNKLIINAMNLKYSKIYSSSIKEYKMFYKNTMKEINMERKIINKQLFEDNYEVSSNAIKIKLFQNFDNLIIRELTNKKVNKDVWI